jgi:hypothetical protein
MVLFILIIMFLERGGKTKDSEPNSSKHSLNLISKFLCEYNFDVLLSFPNICIL